MDLRRSAFDAVNGVLRKKNKGSHFPICAFTENVGRRSPERMRVRAERAAAKREQSQLRQPWPRQQPWQEQQQHGQGQEQQQQQAVISSGKRSSNSIGGSSNSSSSSSNSNTWVARLRRRWMARLRRRWVAHRSRRARNGLLAGTWVARLRRRWMARLRRRWVARRVGQPVTPQLRMVNA